MKRLLCLVALVLSSVCALAKDNTSQTILWPNEEHPVLRFTFGKFVKVGSLSSQNSYTVEVTVQNLWTKPIPDASFECYFFAKDNVRIGTGYMSISNLGVKESAKFTMPFGATGGQPVTLKIIAARLPKELGPAMPAKKVRVTVYSIPSGATLKVDGETMGTTPKQVDFAIGKHLLEFSNEGYNGGKFPFEVGNDDVSGGTVSFELGAAAHDSIEMRDGTTMTGDVESVDATTIVVRGGGKLQSIPRNQVKRILFVERDAPASPPQ